MYLRGTFFSQSVKNRMCVIQKPFRHFQCPFNVAQSDEARFILKNRFHKVSSQTLRKTASHFIHSFHFIWCTRARSYILRCHPTVTLRQQLVNVIFSFDVWFIIELATRFMLKILELIKRKSM